MSINGDMSSVLVLVEVLFLEAVVWWTGGPQVVAKHCRSVPVREEVRAGPSNEGGTVIVRVRCRTRDTRDRNSELVLVPGGLCPMGPVSHRLRLGTVGPSK